MRDQYAGDVSDLLRLAFLRALAADDTTMGVGWYYNRGHGGRYQDGRHREYCDEPKWEPLDEALFRALKAMRKLRERSVKALEELPIWPVRTLFYRVPVPSTANRHPWAVDMKRTLREANIIFLDPDNGLGSSSNRHATVAEVAAMRQPGRAVVLIKFPGRRGDHTSQIEAYHSLLRNQVGAISIATVRTCVSVLVPNKRGLPQRVPRTRWFTIVDVNDVLIERAKQFVLKLNGIENCSADLVCGPPCVERRECQTTMVKRSTPVRVPQQSPTIVRKRRVENVCPLCNHKFKGNGFDGIAAHWRAKHENTMQYKKAWPLIKSGDYPRQSQG
jgi:hypothetical protein